jgi:hypothetical protein
VQESSGFTNKKRAIDAMSIRRTELLERRAGLSQRKMAPKFEEHVEKFLAWSKQQHKPKRASFMESIAILCCVSSVGAGSTRSRPAWWRISNLREREKNGGMRRTGVL